MKTLKWIVITTVITLAIGGIYLFIVFEHRKDPGVARRTDPSDTLTKDDLAVVRTFFPAHFEDTQRLEGTSVWMKNGYTIPYFAYSAGKVDFTKRIALIPADAQLNVKKIVKAAVPAKVDDGIEHGSRQAFAVFELPGGKDQFATPIGFMEGDQEAYYTDLLFYYDDPHKIYDYWPADVWAAIDAHQVKPGMSELETRTSIGQKMHPNGEKEGDRTVTYTQNGKQYTITYVKNRATNITTAGAPPDSATASK